MKIIRLLIQKEFKEIFRNKILLGILFVIPIMQLLILPLAANYEIKHINIAIIDSDHSATSRAMVGSIKASEYFTISGYFQHRREAFIQLEKDQADLILEIPSRFEYHLVRNQQSPISITVNGINGVKANLGSIYLQKIIKKEQQRFLSEWFSPQLAEKGMPVEVTVSNEYNPHMDYKKYMVPGILVLLVTMIGSYMCALNIVREKERGTMEQINVTPIKKYQFIIGKLVPFWVIGMIIFSIGLFGIGRLVYGIVPLGSLVLLYLYLALYLVAVLGLGLLISTYAETQQQAMSVAFFFMMIFILMSGLFTSVNSMPHWAFIITRLNPITYFIEVIRMIVLKGSEFEDLRHAFLIITLIAVFFNTWAVLNYKKTT